MPTYCQSQYVKQPAKPIDNISSIYGGGTATAANDMTHFSVVTTSYDPSGSVGGGLGSGSAGANHNRNNLMSNI